MINKNILFLLGCPCSGKTTVGKMLSEKYDMHYVSGDENRFLYYQCADANKHRYMTMDTSDFWNWSLEGMLDMKYLKQVVPIEQIVYLTVDRKICERFFFERFDHSAMVEAIMKEVGVDDIEKTRRIEMRKLAAINAFYENADYYGFQSLSRDKMKSPAEMVNVVESYWEL